MVDCDKVKDFPDLVMTLGAKTLSLDFSFYTIKVREKCYSRVTPHNHDHWVIADAWLHKFYTKYDLTKDKEKITFYVAK